MRAYPLALAAIVVFLAAAHAAHADETSFLVVVHRSSAVSSLTRRQLADMFLKKVTRWPSGEAVHPVEPPENSMTRAHFLNSVIGRSAFAVRLFWNRRVYEGREVPPVQKRTDDEVVAYVQRTPGAVGYVAPGTSVDGVKVVALQD